MSTHGCFATPFSLLSSFRLLQLDGGSQELYATLDDYYYYYPEDAYFYVETADDQE